MPGGLDVDIAPVAIRQIAHRRNHVLPAGIHDEIRAACFGDLQAVIIQI